MVGARGAQFWGVQKVLRGALLSVRVMVEGSVAHSKGEVYAQKVCMAAHSSVLPTVVERDVLFQSAERVQGGGQISVSVMVVVSGASLRDVGRVPRAVLIFARHMVEARGVLGGTQGQISSDRLPVIGLQGVRLASVLLTVPWFRTVGFMVVAHSDCLSRTQDLPNLPLKI